jgi:metacaspase-1
VIQLNLFISFWSNESNQISLMRKFIFPYSKMRVLCIGINYLDNPRNQLRGCWNDVDSVVAYAKKEGAKDADITIMKDTPELKGTDRYPNCDNIVNQIQKFISSLKSGDKAIFHYSGHGGSVEDRNGDEKDGLDECIYPCDLEEILDDDLRMLLVDSLPDGVKLRCILDCCHSGTGMDLPYRYLSFSKVEKEARASGKDIMCISGCKDAQTSADAYINSKSQGALTASIIKVTSSKHTLWRWKDFLTVLQHELSVSGYSQIPQLSFCHSDAYKSIFDL